MPFIHLSDTHRCHPPILREDGTPVVVGDRWQCDEIRIETLQVCNNTWTRKTDQREGDYWVQE